MEFPRAVQFHGMNFGVLFENRNFGVLGRGVLFRDLAC